MIVRSESNPIRRLFCITGLLAGATSGTAASAALTGARSPSRKGPQR